MAKGRKRSYQPFVVGGLSAMAGAAASNPLDVIKVRMQIEAKKASAVETTIKVFAERSFFNGLTASLARQAVYSSARFGVYDLLKAGRKEVPIVQSILYGLAAGGIGAVVANPFDMTLVRMQADAGLRPEDRRNYKNVFEGVLRIWRSEGTLALWRGATPTCARAMVITASQFAAYDKIKDFFLKNKILENGTPAHFVSAFLAGFVASCTSNPFDVIKTRVYNAPPGTFKSPVDCLRKTIQEGGLPALYKGFVPTFVRQAPYVIVMFLTMEQLNKAFELLDG